MAFCIWQSWVDADDVEYIVYFNGDTQNRNANLNNVANRWNASNEVLAEQWVYNNVSETSGGPGVFVLGGFIHAPICLPMLISAVPRRS